MGKRVIKVDPKGTSQHCWQCLSKVPKSLSERWHSCPECGQELDRDYNSALLIQKIGLLSTQEEGITSVKTAVRISPTEESRALPTGERREYVNSVGCVVEVRSQKSKVRSYFVISSH
ncbi:zinc ribbon domain-containing protein [Hydrocoleum sp. CS-953]|uniref:zinc ribbon domain-containing protein n=1 Tax=Hydrocoleum sp. CS-953 TaxID=1671698 RepID=UPI000B9AAF57|nr:zinc ribbon domain-containing protein [Hydrocoleum sp. CS-953]